MCVCVCMDVIGFVVLLCFCDCVLIDCLDLAKYLNDNIAQTVAEHPKRFVGLGTLPMQAPELVRRCDHCVFIHCPVM